MNRSNVRRSAVVMWLAAEVYQVFFGVFTSLQLGAPGIGARASWAPNVLVAEAFTILPIGFVLCLWGTQSGRALAGLGAAIMVGVAFVAGVTLGRSPSEGVGFFLFLVPPAVALVVSALRVRWATAADAA